MYKVIETDKQIRWNGIVHPLVTLADEYGGRAQIVPDDHCLVLLLKTNPDVPNVPSEESPVCAYKPTCWWFREAVSAIVTEESLFGWTPKVSVSKPLILREKHPPSLRKR